MVLFSVIFLSCLKVNFVLVSKVWFSRVGYSNFLFFLIECFVCFGLRLVFVFVVGSDFFGVMIFKYCEEFNMVRFV